MTEWINVKERLPETDDEVLVWYKYLRYSDLKRAMAYGLARYTGNRWFFDEGTESPRKVLYWLPFPKAPTNEECFAE